MQLETKINKSKHREAIMFTSKTDM